MLNEKVAIVTGGSRGLGRAIALDLAKNGANVVVNYNSNAEAANEVVAEIEALGAQGLAVQADVSDFESAKALAKAAKDHFGKIDVLVNNAGTTRDMLLPMMKEADWDTVMGVNLKSVFNCSKAVLRPMMRAKNGGRIINISSVVGVIGQAGQANYAASKAGMIGFTKSMAKEVGSRGITVNAIAPGFFPTDLTADLPEDLMEKMLEATPLKRLGKLEEVAYLTSFLASDKAAFITGEVIQVDGGIAI